MGVLVDHELRSLAPSWIHPFDPNNIQPCSIDVTLDHFFYKTRTVHFDYAGTLTILDPAENNDFLFGEMIDVPKGETFILSPQDFALATTFETILLPPNVLATFEGKSTYARLGLLTHITAGFIDPGFVGNITLELKNVTPYGIKLYPGMKIGQLVFEKLDTASEVPYGSSRTGSHYQSQGGPTRSRSHINFSVKDVYADD